MKRMARSFANRLTWHIILVTLISMTLITGVIIAVAVFLMAIPTSMHYNDIVALTEENVNKMLTAVEVSVRNNQGYVEQEMATPERVEAVLQEVLLQNSHCKGFFVAMTADYYPQKGRWYEPYAVRRDSVTTELMQVGSEQHDYFQSPWYKTGLESEQGYWSDPYFDADGAHMMLCSYILPVHDAEGNVAGIFGADVSLEWLAEQVRQIDHKNNEQSFINDEDVEGSKEIASYSFILARNGDFIVRPENKGFNTSNFFDYVRSTKSASDDLLLDIIEKGESGFSYIDLNGKASFVFCSPMERIGWTMAIVVPMQMLLMWGLIMGGIVSVLMVLGMLAVSLVSYRAIRKITQPLVQLAASANEVAKGNFDVPLPEIQHNDEIGVLRNSFEDMQRSLAQYVEQLQVTTANNAAMESELAIARGIQEAMLPKEFARDLPEIEIYGLQAPAKTVGGDLYEYRLHDDKLFFCIGDVSGKGVPASLIMAVTCVMLRTLTEREVWADRIVTMLNNAEVSNNDSNMFVTLFVGVLDLKTHVLNYCNAGHDAPLLIDSDGTLRRLECDANLPIGVMPEFQFSRQETTLKPGTTLFLFTDGLTEAEDSTHSQFGVDRLVEVLRSAGTSGTQKLIEEMTEAVRSFVGNAEQSDDLTMMSIKVNNM